MQNFFDIALEFFYIIAGLMFFLASFSSFRDHTNSKRIGTGLFWFVLGIIFVFGKWLPSIISGILVCIIAVITLFRQYGAGEKQPEDTDTIKARADRLRWKVFIPMIALSVGALSVPFIFPEAGATSLAFGSLAGLVVALVVFKPSAKQVVHESERMVKDVGTTAILPQLLAALGAIFVASGVGEVVSQLIGRAVPEGSIFAGVVAYVLGMALFTMVMGNAFAAFTVITAGIGVPFVIMQGGDPVIVAALGMTAGFCGTLMTPMAGNFNVLPVAILEMNDENGVLKAQIPFAIVTLIFHIVLMYVWAF